MNSLGKLEHEELLEYLTEERILYQNGDKWYWMNDSFPAHNISLRSASQENVIIVDQSDVANARVIGEMDRFSAMTLLHDEAIYLHQGTQFQVEKLDWDEKKAFVREVDVDYFTDANLAVQLKVLEEDKLNKQEMIQKLATGMSVFEQWQPFLKKSNSKHMKILVQDQSISRRKNCTQVPHGFR